MEKSYYLGLDQGTTGETALLLDRDMRVVARGYHEHRRFFPKPGWGASTSPRRFLTVC